MILSVNTVRGSKASLHKTWSKKVVVVQRKVLRI